MPNPGLPHSVAGLTMISAFSSEADEEPSMTVLVPNAALRRLDLGMRVAFRAGLLPGLHNPAVAVGASAPASLVFHTLSCHLSPPVAPAPLLLALLLAGPVISLNIRRDTPDLKALKEAGALVSRNMSDFNRHVASLLQQVRCCCFYAALCAAAVATAAALRLH